MTISRISRIRRNVDGVEPREGHVGKNEGDEPAWDVQHADKWTTSVSPSQSPIV
jgi:hypothetical protein